MEEKAKRIGKFNIIDIIAVILIVAVVAFGAWKLLGSSGGTAAEDGGMVKVTYVVKCEGVPTELYETCQAHLPSPLMASGALVGGQIERVEMEPYYVLGPDGQWIEDPEHVTLLHRHHGDACRRGHDYQGGRPGGPDRQDGLYFEE